MLKTGDIRYIYQNKLYNFCLQLDMAHGSYKDLPRKTAPDKVLHNKVLAIAINLKYDRYKNGLASMAYKYLDIKF